MSLALALLALVPQVGSWTATELPKFGASDAEELDQFGQSICVDGDTALVLARLGGPTDDGAVYVLERDAAGAWTETAQLLPSAPGPSFGDSLALHGDVAVVGDTFAGSNFGAAFVFERDAGGPDAWGEVAQLLASDGAYLDSFGSSAAVWGDTVVVGAPLDDHGEPGGSAYGDGSVYVFEKQAGLWVETERLTASDAVPSQTVLGDSFGHAVALDADRLLVGSPGFIGPGSSSPMGAAYVFDRDGLGVWQETVRLEPHDPEPGSEFGSVVDLIDGLFAAGAPKASGGGAVYLFEQASGGAWQQLAKLTGAGVVGGDQFGASLDLTPTRLVVGAPERDAPGQSLAGGAYVFDRDQGGPSAWGQVAELSASDAFRFDDFGRAVAATPTGALVGAPSDGLGISTVYGIDSMAFDPGTGTWYGLDEQQNRLVTIDPLEGWGTAKPAYLATNIVSITFDPLSGTLYGEGGGNLHTINPAIGSSTVLAPTGSNYGVDALAFDSLRGLFVGINAYYRAPIVLDLVSGTASDPLLGYNRIEGSAYDPVANVLYACDVTADELLVIDTVTGNATSVGPLGFARIEALACDPATGTLYGADNQVNQLVSIDPATGAATAIGSLGSNPDITGLAFDPGTGLLWGVNLSADNLLSIDPTTAAKTVVGSFTNRPIESLAFDPNTGRLYGVDVGQDRLVLIDTSTGAVTGIGTMIFDHVAGLAFDANTGTIYGADQRFARLITIDGFSGAAQPATPMLGFNDVRSLVYDPDADEFFGVDRSTDRLLSIDPVTYTAQVIAPVAPKSIVALALDPLTDTLLGSNGATDELIDIDPVSGATTAIGIFGATLSLGSVYPFELEYPPTTYCAAGLSAAGCPAAIGATGTASASAGSGFDLTAVGVEGQKSAQFYYGTSGIQANPWGNGSSLQCVVPPIVRGGLLAPSGTAGACNGSFVQDLNALWSAKPAKNPGAGVFVQAQLWYRDPASTSNQTTSLSNAIEFYVGP